MAAQKAKPNNCRKAEHGTVDWHDRFPWPFGIPLQLKRGTHPLVLAPLRSRMRRLEFEQATHFFYWKTLC
jgi:hypothetical protein